jgi:hypothetical protein
MYSSRILLSLVQEIFTCLKIFSESYAATVRKPLFIERSSPPIPVTTRSKAQTCGHSLAGIAFTNSAEGVLPLVNVVCCQEEVSTTGRPPDQECACVSLSVIRCNSDPLQLQWNLGSRNYFVPGGRS